MGILDKIKNIAGKAKGAADEQVDKHSDKIPDKVGKAYGKASDAAGKVVPGKDSKPKHEQIMEDG